MCGISGLLYTQGDKAVAQERLEQLNGAMAHRGPDDAGCWCAGAAGFAQRRLSILDLSPGGHQPMLSEDGRYVLVYNGELYNYRDLKQALEQAGHAFASQCDTEVLLKALMEWGDDAVKRFNGMFAFAFYDRHEKRLLLGRDRLGIKPLFYLHHNGLFAFASELDALRQAGIVPDGLNHAALDAYLTYLYIPGPETIYPHVYKLLPGEMLVVERGELSHQLFWDVPAYGTADLSLEEAAEQLLELLRESVRRRMISDVPLGAFLSGGVDSSTVVGLLSELSSTPVKTFTIGFDDAHVDELKYARIAAEHFGTDHYEEILKPDMVDLLPRLARHFGEPFADSSALPMWLVSQTAKKQVTVALSGDGGDELFAGYTWLHRSKQVARYRQVPALMRRLLDGGSGLLPKTPQAEKVRRFSQDSFLAPVDSFRRRLTCFSELDRIGLYKPDFMGQMADGLNDFLQIYWAQAPTGSDDARMLYADTKQYLPDDILTKVDRMSMAHGLEARVPLLDHTVVEFAAGLPFDLKYQGGVSKRVLKHAVRNLLPPELLAQRKQGFSIPIQRWFREDLREHFAEVVLDSSAKCHDHFRPKAIRQIFDQHVGGQENHGHKLWALLMLEHWLQG